MFSLQQTNASPQNIAQLRAKFHSILSACLRHSGKTVIRQRNSKKSGRLEHHKSRPIAAITYERKVFFGRQKIAIILSQQDFGRPMRLCPCGCQAITLLILNDQGIVKYYAKF